MPSMFKMMAKSLVREAGKKDLNPVNSLSSSPRFRPFCLLRKRSKKHKCWSKKFTCTEFSLMDILEPNYPVPEVSQERRFYFWNKVNGKLKGGLSMDEIIRMDAYAGAEQSRSSYLVMQILTVSHQTWRALQMERKLVNPEPSFIRELRSRGEDLYVVIEAMELLNSPVLETSINLEGAGKISVPETNVEGQGQGVREKQKFMTVPPGSIVAYRAAKLNISENKWDLENEVMPDMRHELHIQPGQYEDTQQESEIARPCDSEDESTSGLQSLQEKTTSMKKKLNKLPREQWSILLCALQDLLGNRMALQELEAMLSQALKTRKLGKLEGPGSTILQCLQDDSGSPMDSPITGLLYVLRDLAVLTDSQHQLLAQSLEKKILPQQLDLVRSILKANFNQCQRGSFSIQPESLSLLWGENLDITLGLVEQCSLELQRLDLQLAWDQDAQILLSALYGALSCLQ
ncbi:gasdermin-C-like [Trichosurus vulpecula]|uniref:gasdermin-C-like n=1 Tax=Trichosurus vulpecula TaxID=9337 RepID=UPI00186ADA54|nr:gasdermin-C-like [Trichosurus vulpecula]